MKKFTAVFILLFICAGLLSCGEVHEEDNAETNAAVIEQADTPAQYEMNEAYYLYKKMTELMADIKSIDMEISALSDLSIDGEEASTYADGNIKKVINSDTDIEIYTDFEMYINGDFITSMAAYYTGGIYYSSSSSEFGGDIKQSYKMEDIQHAAFMPHADLLDFPESAVKDYKISDYNGGKKIEMTLDGNNVTSLLEKEQGVDDLYISEVICEFIIDENNMLKFHRTIYEIKMTLRIPDENNVLIDSHYDMKRDTSVTVNSYNDVVIDFPDDLDEYEYFEAVTVMV